MSFSYWRVIVPAFMMLPLITMTNVFAKDSWQQTYENGIWNIKSTKFKCALSQKIEGVAEVAIVRTPEYKTRLILDLQFPEIKISSATVKIKPADWKNISNISINQPIYNGYVNELSVIYDDVGREVLDAIAAGDWLDFEVNPDNNSKEIVFTNTRGFSAVTAFRNCLSDMAPISWESARDNDFFFEKGKKNISSARDIKKLQDLVRYIKLDGHINKVLVDGYSDSVGNSIANRQLSQQRADDVASRLVEFGLKPAQLEVRAHGSRYPVVNNNDKDQGLNRRVSVRLIRKDNGVVKQ